MFSHLRLKSRSVITRIVVALKQSSLNCFAHKLDFQIKYYKTRQLNLTYSIIKWVLIEFFFLVSGECALQFFFRSIRTFYPTAVGKFRFFFFYFILFYYETCLVVRYRSVGSGNLFNSAWWMGRPLFHYQPDIILRPYTRFVDG